MIKQLVRRSSLALALGLIAATSVGTAQAAVTGTDPCPKGMWCVAQSVPSAVSPASSSLGSVAQVFLVLFGLA